MTEFTITTTYTVSCLGCDSNHIVKVGVRNGQQRYRCKGCKKDFRAGGKAEGRKMDAEMMGSAIRDYYTGKSYKQIAEGLKEEYNLAKEPSKATIYEWVRDYTDRAVGQMQDHKARTGGHWVADELQVDVGGEKMWLWNVMDAKTRYILASHLTPRRDAQAARVVLRKAALAADAPPRSITSDKLRSYIRPIRDVLPEAEHIQSEGIRASVNNNLSERLQGTFRDRIKTLRGLDSRKTGQRYLDGWTLTYNLFRGHEALGNETPGERAKMKPPFREWADVVKDGAASLPKVKAEKRPSPSSPKLRPPQADPDKKPGKAKRRRRIKRPVPVFPKLATEPKNRTRPPRWARLIPRFPAVYQNAIRRKQTEPANCPLLASWPLSALLHALHLTSPLKR